jgi:hypothetical protein
MSMAVANLDSSGVEMRLRSAVFVFALGMGLAVVLRMTTTSPWALSVMVVPFFLTSWLTFQGLYRTCTVMAKDGTRDYGDGRERVACPQTRSKLHHRGRYVMLLSVSVAMVATACMILVARI